MPLPENSESRTKTFADEIETAANGEPILSIVIGASREGYTWDETPPTHKANSMLTWEVARPVLDYDYHRGYGAPDCHAITAWTASRVIFVHEYDGATSVYWLPRNPVDHEPEHSGLYGEHSV